MLEGISNELFLLDNKLEDVDSSVLNKLVKRLSPQSFNYVRPSHAIMKINPTTPMYSLDKNTSFILKKLPDNIRSKKISSVPFTPVVSTKIYDINVSHQFCNQTLYSVNERGERKIVGYSEKRAAYNTIWFGLEIGSGIETLKDIFFYMDFPHLPDHHDYYDILQEVKWCVDTKPIDIKRGLPLDQKYSLSKTEKEILDFYKDHYQTIDSKINIKDIPRRNLPEDIDTLFDMDIISSLSPLRWISITFPANFNQRDIENLFITPNAFPVLNRHLNQVTVYEKDLESSVSLSSGIGQEFLDVESVIDSKNTVYERKNILDGVNSYTVEPIRRKNVEDPRIVDYLERLADLVQDERTAFPGIDNEKIVNVLNAVSSIQDKDAQRIELNRLKEYAEVALLAIKPNENTTFVDIFYWTTLSTLLNGIPRGTSLMANKIPELNKSDAIFITSTIGGRNFYDLDSLKAINSYQLTSKDRILTKYNIIDFCRIELGRYVESIDVIRKAIVSRRSKEGIIIVMQIQVTPKKKYIEYFKQKGVFKDLLIRLRQRSPNNFNYKIKLIE